jgi:hypothetical protein
VLPILLVLVVVVVLGCFRIPWGTSKPLAIAFSIQTSNLFHPPPPETAEDDDDDEDDSEKRVRRGRLTYFGIKFIPADILLSRVAFMDFTALDEVGDYPPYRLPPNHRQTELS